MTSTRTSPPRAKTAARWQNWGRTQSVTPREVVAVGDTDDVVAAVRRARSGSTTVKAVGSGHSFTGIALAPGMQLDTHAMTGVVAVEAAARRVTVRAGTRLRDMPALLGPLGLALPNLGDIDAQSISGATSTGTHGTGRNFGGLSTQIVGLTMVSGTGEVVTVTEDDRSMLQAAALGLGALGIVTEITLACVPAFALEATERPMPVDDAIAGFLDAVATNDHHEFYWFPHTEVALSKTNRRLAADTPADGPGRVRRFVDDEILSNGLFGAMCAVGARAPALTPRLARVAGGALSSRRFVDSSQSVFVSDRRVRFREMEYAIPLAEIPSAIDEIRRLIARNDYRVSFPIEVRAAAADELMLSTASGRTTGYIAVHRFHGDRPDDFFNEVEKILFARDGRPHWGKMHTRTADDLRTVYPRFDEFRALRDTFDPDRLFANDYLTGVLGR